MVPKENEGEVFPFASTGPRYTKAELLELIPPRRTMDKILENYFSWYGQMFREYPVSVLIVVVCT